MISAGARKSTRLYHRPIKIGIAALRGALASLLALCLWRAEQASAATIDYLHVPSAAMGRDIPVAFQAGGPHAVFLLDAFDAGGDVSNWLTAAPNALGGKGVSLVAPAGGAYGLYTNWEQDGSKQWETFLSTDYRTGWWPTKGWLPAVTGSSGPPRAVLAH